MIVPNQSLFEPNRVHLSCSQHPADDVQLRLGFEIGIELGFVQVLLVSSGGTSFADLRPSQGLRNTCPLNG